MAFHEQPFISTSALCRRVNNAMKNEGAVMDRTTERVRGYGEEAALANISLGVTPIEARALEKQRGFEPVKQGFQLQYENSNGRLYQGNSFDWLESLDDASVDLVFADPPYNIKKADWDNFDSQEKYIEWSIKWITQSSRVLKPTGSLYVCGFSEILADLKHPASKYFKHCRWLIWHYKNKANLGSDWGRYTFGDVYGHFQTIAAQHSMSDDEAIAESYCLGAI